MKEIKTSLYNIDKTTFDLGYVGEKNHTRVVINCVSIFKSFPNAVATMTAKPPVGDLYPVALTREGVSIIWDVSESDIANAGVGQYQLTFTNGSGDSAEIIKTVYGKYSVKSSLAPTGDPPEPMEDWLEQAAVALETFEENIEDIDRITAAEAGDVGKALSPKTVTNGKVTEWDYIDPLDEQLVQDLVDDWFDDHPSVAQIDDTSTALNKVWSAYKVSEEFAETNGEVSALKSAFNPIEKMLKIEDFSYPSSDSYSSNLTDFWLNVGESVTIKVTETSASTVFIDGYSSESISLTSVNTYTFTALHSGYLKFYHKKLVCTVIYSAYRVTSELGSSEYLLASQKLVNNLATEFDKAVGYKTAKLENGYYFVGSTVGGTVKRSASTNNWDYSAVPLFVKAGKIVHCTTRASGMCCIAKSQSATWTDNVPIAVAIADDNVNAKEYTVRAVEDAYYWFSGRTGETTAYIENNDSGEIIVVDINGGGNYTSLTACLTALKNNTKKKTIYIKEGTYDIFSELGGAEYIASITNPGSKNWRDVQPVVPRNTKIIGQGNVKLTFLPDASVIGSNEMAFLFSPLNVDSDCEIENIAIDCTNCRYALHIESSSIADYNDSVMKFKNVRCKKTHGTYGTQYVSATGIGSRQKWEFDACSFEGDLDIIWSVHVNNTVANDMAVVIMNNCVFVCTANNPEGKNTIRFVSNNNSPVIQNIAKLNNCYTNGKVFLENNNTRQQWDVTLLGCEYAGVGQSTQIVDNPYPIKEY